VFRTIAKCARIFVSEAADYIIGPIAPMSLQVLPSPRRMLSLWLEK
jgi:hypothetical protein